MIIYSNFTPKTRMNFTEFFTPVTYFRPRKNALNKSLNLIVNLLDNTPHVPARGRIGRGIKMDDRHVESSFMRISMSPFSAIGYCETLAKPENRNSNLDMNRRPPSKVVNRHIAFKEFNDSGRLINHHKQCYVNFMTCYGLYGKGFAYNLKMFYERYNEVSEERWLKFIELFVANTEQFQSFIDSQYYQIHTKYAPLVKGDKLFHSFSTLLFAFHMWSNHISVANQSTDNKMIVVSTSSRIKNDYSFASDSRSMRMKSAKTKPMPIVLFLDKLQPIADAKNNIIFDDFYLNDVCKYPDIVRSFIGECFAFYKPNSPFMFATNAS